eukprot:1159317-Pelagomonas_calceolata.AAC.5
MLFTRQPLMSFEFQHSVHISHDTEKSSRWSNPGFATCCSPQHAAFYCSISPLKGGSIEKL